MVDRFLEKGFTYFDTSYVYHNGKSETALREALVKRYDRPRFLLADKLPVFAITEPEKVAQVFNEQLERCGVSYFDFYLLHNLNKSNYEAQVRSCQMFEFMREKQSEGKIRQIGFSFHDSAEVLDRILTEHPEVDFVQIVVSYYDWESALIQSRACYEVIRRYGAAMSARRAWTCGTPCVKRLNFKKKMVSNMRNSALLQSQFPSTKMVHTS